MVVARKRRSLSGSGAIAALVVGAICVAAGWGWAALLIGFFVSSTLLSTHESARKQSRVSNVVAKGGERDAWQVVANGGLFTAIAAASVLSPSALWLCAGAGSIAASAADTWATEIGVLSSVAPRSIATGAPVPAGQSGGVTWAGTLAGIGGALFIASITFLVGWTTSAVVSAVAGGVGGCVIDSLLGATVQVRRWCDRCNTGTERTVHSCGTTTRVAGGLPWLNNDAVNATSSACGALLGVVCFLSSRWLQVR